MPAILTDISNNGAVDKGEYAVHQRIALCQSGKNSLMTRKAPLKGNY